MRGGAMNRLRRLMRRLACSRGVVSAESDDAADVLGGVIRMGFLDCRGQVHCLMDELTFFTQLLA